MHAQSITSYGKRRNQVSNPSNIIWTGWRFEVRSLDLISSFHLPKAEFSAVNFLILTLDSSAGVLCCVCAA